MAFDTNNNSVLVFVTLLFMLYRQHRSNFKAHLLFNIFQRTVLFLPRSLAAFQKMKYKKRTHHAFEINLQFNVIGN